MSTLQSSMIQGLFSAPLANPNSLFQGGNSIQDANVINFPLGNAVGQADGAFAGNVSVTNGTPLVIDLTNPAGTSGLAVVGVAAVASSSHLMSLNIQNNSTTIIQIFTVGGGSNPIIAAMTWTIGPGGIIALGDKTGLAIASGTKNLELQVASGTGVSIGISGSTRSA